METVYRDYSDKGVKFYYIYKSLAHPELNGYVQPVSLEERLLHIKQAKRSLGSEITWLADSISNDFKHAMGNAPNSEFIIDPEGKIARKRAWSRPAELRKDLEEFVGKVEKPTTVADLNLKTERPPKAAASGIVKRIQLPGRLQALKVTPQKSDQPFYVKLRAEAEQSLLGSRDGQLYLGFHLDPIYHVHWNNLVAPIKFEITAEGAEVTPSKGEGPKVKQAADIDPREFLVQVKVDSPGPLKLKVHYFACNDEEGWCKPVTQEFVVSLQRDPDAGRPMRRGSFGGLAGRNSGGRRVPDSRSSPELMVKRMLAYDRNKDGKVTKDELPRFRQNILKRADTNGDGALDKGEIEAAAKRIAGRGSQR